MNLLLGVMHHTPVDVVTRLVGNPEAMTDSIAYSCDEEFKGVHFDSKSRREESEWSCSLMDGNATIEWAVSCTPASVHHSRIYLQEILTVLKQAYSNLYAELNVNRNRYANKNSDVSMRRVSTLMDTLVRDVEKGLHPAASSSQRRDCVCMHKHLWTHGPLANVMKNTS